MVTDTAMTNRDVAMRTLWGAGLYLETRPRTPNEMLSIAEAVWIIGAAYNSIYWERRKEQNQAFWLGEPYVSGQKPIQR